MKKIMSILLYSMLATMLYANFEVAPQIHEINLDRPTTRKIYLKNGTNKLKKIKIYSQVPEDQKDKSLYMGDWIIVYPKIVYLKPNGKQVVRMAARPPQGLADGEYRAELVFEELPTEKHNEEGDTEKVGVNVQILYKLISTVYGHKGKLEYSGEFGDFKIETIEKNTVLHSKAENTGNVALETFYKLTYLNGVKKLKEEELRVGKIMRENSLDSILKLDDKIKKSTSLKIEYYYILKETARDGSEIENKVKLGEKTIKVK